MTRDHDVRQLTTAELELTMRQLRANLGLIRPDSPANAPVQAHMRAIDAELTRRPGNQQPGADERHDSGVPPGPFPRDPSGRR